MTTGHVQIRDNLDIKQWTVIYRLAAECKWVVKEHATENKIIISLVRTKSCRPGYHSGGYLLRSHDRSAFGVHSRLAIRTH